MNRIRAEKREREDRTASGPSFPTSQKKRGEGGGESGSSFLILEEKKKEKKDEGENPPNESDTALDDLSSPRTKRAGKRRRCFPKKEERDHREGK